jgi:hypothetical protein
MRKLFVALAGAAVLAACDPTDKNDYSCTLTFEGVTDACMQLYITEPEGNVADGQCRGRGGTWEYHPCAAGHIDGYCRVDDAADYSFSGTPAKVFFYAPVTPAEAIDACEAAGGVWTGAGA